MPSILLATNSASLPPTGDLLRSYLRDIGRVPLLSHEQEITLGRQVQELMGLEELREELAIKPVVSPLHRRCWRRRRA